MSCRCPVQEALVVKLLNSTFLCIYLGKFGLCLLCFYFINFLPCRSSVTYARCMVVLLYWSGVWFFWLLLRILASPVAEPCSAYGGRREECIPYFYTCTLIFMYMQPDILILTVVVRFFSGDAYWIQLTLRWKELRLCGFQPYTYTLALSCKLLSSGFVLLFLDFH